MMPFYEAIVSIHPLTATFILFVVPELGAGVALVVQHSMVR